ncbi:hypothetical protein ABPG75_007399 [Micractinium tetrahymenae]
MLCFLPAHVPARCFAPLWVQRARHGSRRRWWSDAWEEDEPSCDSSLDGGSAARPEQVTTIFCSDGSVVRLGAVPNPALAELERQRQQRRAGGSAADLLGGGAGSAAPLPLPHEQGLCIGSVFTISATNGVDAARRLNLLGFCFSTEQLFERVEETVLRRGGEIFETRRQLKSGVHEVLHMSLAIPLLFGVPPEYERLKRGVIQGGGVIERIQQQWVIY